MGKLLLLVATLMIEWNSCICQLEQASHPGHYCHAVTTCDVIGDIVEYVTMDATSSQLIADVMRELHINSTWIKRRDWKALPWNCSSVKSETEYPDDDLCPSLTLDHRYEEEKGIPVDGLSSTEEREEEEDDERVPVDRYQYKLVQKFIRCTEKVPVLCRVNQDEDGIVNPAEPIDSRTGLSPGEIVGIIFGVLVTMAILFLAVVVLILILKLRKGRKLHPGGEGHDNPSYHGSVNLEPRRRKVSFSPDVEGQTQGSSPRVLSEGRLPSPRILELRRQSTKSSGLYAVIDETALDDDVANVNDIQDDYDDVIEKEHSDVTDSGYGEPDHRFLLDKFGVASTVDKNSNIDQISQNNSGNAVPENNPNKDVIDLTPDNDDITPVDDDVFRASDSLTPRTTAFFFGDDDSSDDDDTGILYNDDDITLVDNVTYATSPTRVTDDDVKEFFEDSVIDSEEGEVKSDSEASDATAKHNDVMEGSDSSGDILDNNEDNKSASSSEISSDDESRRDDIDDVFADVVDAPDDSSPVKLPLRRDDDTSSDAESIDDDDVIEKDDDYVTEKNDDYVTEKDDDYVTEKDDDYVTEKDDDYVTESDSSKTDEKLSSAATENTITFVNEKASADVTETAPSDVIEKSSSDVPHDTPESDTEPSADANTSSGLFDDVAKELGFTSSNGTTLMLENVGDSESET